MVGKKSSTMDVAEEHEHEYGTTRKGSSVLSTTIDARDVKHGDRALAMIGGERVSLTEADVSN